MVGRPWATLLTKFLSKLSLWRIEQNLDDWLKNQYIGVEIEWLNHATQLVATFASQKIWWTMMTLNFSHNYLDVFNNIIDLPWCLNVSIISVNKNLAISFNLNKLISNFSGLIESKVSAPSIDVSQKLDAPTCRSFPVQSRTTNSLVALFLMRKP